MVEEEKLITAEEFEEDILVANITPGALPVEIAGGIGNIIDRVSLEYVIDFISFVLINFPIFKILYASNFMCHHSRLRFILIFL